MLDIQPSWVDCFDDSIFRQIMDEIPQELYKNETYSDGKGKDKSAIQIRQDLSALGARGRVANSERQVADIQSSEKSQGRRHKNILLLL